MTTWPKGWINRQVARMEQESKTWPEWMRREIDVRVQDLKSEAGKSKD